MDTTERLHFHFSLSCTGEGNGNPLQCSCLENPRDGGAWWAAVCGVAQSRTRLKRLSSSSSMSAAYEAKNKPRELTAVLSLGPEAPQHSAFSLSILPFPSAFCLFLQHSAFSFPPFRVFLCLFCVFYPGLLVVYSGWNRKNVSTPSSQKWRFSSLFEPSQKLSQIV